MQLRNALALVLVMTLLSGITFAQQGLSRTWVSPKASVSQTIAFTQIDINYFRPLVKDREIWGKLVPYGTIWRAGANNNTTISFSTAVMVNGNELAAGTYGLHTIPGEKEWTVIFSNNNHLWGSFRYDESEDALRITVAPQSGPHQEALQFSFAEVSQNSATVELAWEKVRVPVKIDIDVHETTIAQYNKELRGLQGFFPASLVQAASYCANNNTHHEQGIQWADAALQRGPTFAALNTKARLLDQTGKSSEAEALMAQAMPLANENDLNNYGYQLLGAKNYKKAIAIFKKNVKEHPKSWNTYDSLAEAFQRSGDTKQAIKYYNKALSMVTDPNQQNRIKGVLASLQAS